MIPISLVCLKYIQYSLFSLFRVTWLPIFCFRPTSLALNPVNAFSDSSSNNTPSDDSWPFTTETSNPATNQHPTNDGLFDQSQFPPLPEQSKFPQIGKSETITHQQLQRKDHSQQSRQSRSRHESESSNSSATFGDEFTTCEKHFHVNEFFCHDCCREICKDCALSLIHI